MFRSKNQFNSVLAAPLKAVALLKR